MEMRGGVVFRSLLVLLMNYVMMPLLFQRFLSELVLIDQIDPVQSMSCKKNALGRTAWVIGGLYTACYSARPTNAPRRLHVYYVLIH